METLTSEEYKNIFRENVEKTEKEVFKCNGFDNSIKHKDKFSTGLLCYVELRPGLWLVIDKEYFEHDLSFWSHHNEQPFPLISHFHLSSNLRTITPGMKEIPDDYIEYVGRNYLFYLPNIDEIEQHLAGEHRLDINIIIYPDWLRSFSKNFEFLPTSLQSFLKDEYSPRFYHDVGEITSAMFAVLQQMLDAPYQGMMKRMYLESKVIELLALQFNQLLYQEQTIHLLVNLKPADIEKIYHARDILIYRVDNPPSLLDLAEMVHLGERKLQQGFKEIFGTTVFGYLHDYRMEQAKMMLSGTKMQVAEVSNAVGYAHLGYFAQTFKKKFGVTPKECQLGKKPLK
ncbi:MAG: AraC family transcriptional regulator [Nostoc sp. S4]|nr:AraC family transcriptional regulator [Nostoc sp. S4]